MGLAAFSEGSKVRGSEDSGEVSLGEEGSDAHELVTVMRRNEQS